MLLISGDEHEGEARATSLLATLPGQAIFSGGARRLGACTSHPAADVVIAAVNRGRVRRVVPKAMHAVTLRDEIERALREGVATIA